MTNMLRLPRLVLWMTTIFSLILTLPFAASTLTAQTRTIPLLSQPELAPYGLERVWFHQLKLHSANGRVQNILLEGGQLFITTSDAMLHVIDSETGEWLWSRSMGGRDLPLTEPAVNSRVVAVHNNLEVFLFNRKNGKQLLQIPLPESASAPCEMSEHYLYVPMVNEILLIYPLREAHTPQAYEEPIAVRPLAGHQDPELAKIVQQFEDAKRLLYVAEPEIVREDAFVLDSTHRIPITVATLGTVRTKPLLLSQFYDWELDDDEQPTHEVNFRTHHEYLSWVTEQGFLYTAALTQLSGEGMRMLYRVDSAGQTFFIDRTRAIQIDRPGNRELVTRPTQSQLYPANGLTTDRIISPDVIVTGGRAAYIFAVDARTGAVRWQYPTRGQLLEPIALIGRDVYAPTADGILHAIDLVTGNERWAADGVRRFVAASQQRLYVLDQRGRLTGLDRATGAAIFVYDIRRFEHCLYNLETDQVFLITDTGLIQCLRERQFTDEERRTSLRHRISSIEFAVATRGGDMPELWWTGEMAEEKREEEVWEP